MYALFEGNEKHYCKVLEITDNRYWDKPNLTLKCRGFIFSRSREKESGVNLEQYNFFIRVYGMLIDYVLNEIMVNDFIFVIGHTSMAVVNKYNIRVTTAEQIYKSEWTTYYNLLSNDGTSWRDWGNE